MKVQFINYPLAITDTGEGIPLKDCITQPSVGDRVEFDSELNLYMVYKSSDTDCVSGVCPMK